MTEPKSFILRNDSILHGALSFIRSLPVDDKSPLQIIIKPFSKKRTKEQNSYAWSGMIGDFVTQGWVDGMRFSEKTWHHHLKKMFLPEQPEEGITLAGYRKWDISPDGEMVLVGSTTQLTVRGFSEYLHRCCAWGAEELGIRFTTRGDE